MTPLVTGQVRRSDSITSPGWAATSPRPRRCGDRDGPAVQLPDIEFETAERVFDTETVQSDTACRNTVQGYVALLLTVEADERTAVLFPGYCALADDFVYDLFDRVADAGRLTVYLRRLDETSVQVTMEDPDLLAPPKQ